MRKTLAVPHVIPGNETESSLMLECRIVRGHIKGITKGRLLVTDELPNTGAVHVVSDLSSELLGLHPQLPQRCARLIRASGPPLDPACGCRTTFSPDLVNESPIEIERARLVEPLHRMLGRDVM